MRQISKTNAEKITQLYGKMNSALEQYNTKANELDSKIQALVNQFNSENEELIESLQATYNQAASELKGIVSEQFNLMESYIYNRTDAWQDSQNGFDYRYWTELWDEFGDFLENAEFQEFQVAYKMEEVEKESLPPFNPKLK